MKRPCEDNPETLALISHVMGMNDLLGVILIQLVGANTKELFNTVVSVSKQWQAEGLRIIKENVYISKSPFYNGGKKIITQEFRNALYGDENRFTKLIPIQKTMQLLSPYVIQPYRLTTLEDRVCVIHLTGTRNSAKSLLIHRLGRYLGCHHILASGTQSRDEIVDSLNNLNRDKLEGGRPFILISCEEGYPALILGKYEPLIDTGEIVSRDGTKTFVLPQDVNVICLLGSNGRPIHIEKETHVVDFSCQ